MITNANFPLSCMAVLAMIPVLVSGCGPSVAEQERMSTVAKVKKIAVVAMVGKSSASPEAKIYEKFMDDFRTAFEKETAKAPPVVEFIPLAEVTENEAYQSVAKIKMPDDAYSPVEGLTYVRQGTEAGFDCGPLAESLNVDAVVMIVIDFGVAVRSNASTFHLAATVEGDLIGPPEVLLWRAPRSLEELIPITIISHPKLVGAIGAKWVVMTRPSADEYAQLMRIAGENDTKLPGRIAATIVGGIVKDIKKSREYQADKT